jgi:hypothetical protein
MVTPVGSPDTFSKLVGALTPAGSISTSTSYTVWAWVYATAARTYTLQASWFLNGSSVSVGSATGVAVPAGAWTFISGTITSPASGVNEVKLEVSDNSSPTAAQTYRVWGLNAAATSTISASSPQGFTVVRSVNGVVKAQTSGTDARLFFPPIAAL